MLSAEKQITGDANEFKELPDTKEAWSKEASSLFIHTLIPKNKCQQVAVHWLDDSHPAVIFLIGAAGCGKTALAVDAGIWGIEAGLYDYILLTRVNIEAGQPVGFLRGDAVEKNSVWI